LKTEAAVVFLCLSHLIAPGKFDTGIAGAKLTSFTGQNKIVCQ